MRDNADWRESKHVVECCTVRIVASLRYLRRPIRYFTKKCWNAEGQIEIRFKSSMKISSLFWKWVCSEIYLKIPLVLRKYAGMNGVVDKRKKLNACANGSKQWANRQKMNIVCHSSSRIGSQSAECIHYNYARRSAQIWGEWPKCAWKCLQSKGQLLGMGAGIRKNLRDVFCESEKICSSYDTLLAILHEEETVR